VAGLPIELESFFWNLSWKQMFPLPGQLQELTHNVEPRYNLLVKVHPEAAATGHSANKPSTANVWMLTETCRDQRLKGTELAQHGDRRLRTFTRLF
jgi:hypothetical protein